MEKIRQKRSMIIYKYIGKDKKRKPYELVTKLGYDYNTCTQPKNKRFHELDDDPDYVWVMGGFDISKMIRQYRYLIGYLN